MRLVTLAAAMVLAALPSALTAVVPTRDVDSDSSGQITFAAAPSESEQTHDSGAADDFARVKLTLGVMSRCPDAVLVETLFDRVLERKTSSGLGDNAPETVAGLVDLRLDYIASKNSSALYDATCKHGDIECRGNIQQLCAADLWEIPSSSRGDRKSQTEPDASGDVNVSLKGNQAWEDWWNNSGTSLQFVQCLNYGELSRIGTDNAASACAKVVGHSWDAREQHCVDGKRGRKLLRKSVKRTRKHEVQKSATVLINDEVICVHDGSWQSCPGGHEISDFVKQIEAEWKRINPEKKHAE
ncbi:hypothetical protein C6P46_000480 [Rhodotorula mucilaginosa]|uniref:Secreted protein n=1 Tax=Rhodotorula mucilaginosa TaxID=5537 RepID=A0A9P6VWP6_RHOMI|nr:hypothetical protein C6P46_000480 [Rhodotorula mucilaginosa]